MSPIRRWISGFRVHYIRRAIRFWWQRRTRGFDDSETWNLDYTIAKFVVPRLRRFKELNNGCPIGITPDQWDSSIDEMIYAMEETIAFNEGALIEFDIGRAQRGRELFGQYLCGLWW